MLKSSIICWLKEPFYPGVLHRLASVQPLPPPLLLRRPRPQSSLLLLNVLQKPREAAVEAAVSMCVEGGR